MLQNGWGTGQTLPRERETDVSSRRKQGRSGWIKLAVMCGFAAVAIWSLWSGALFTLPGIVAQWLTDVALN